MSRRWLMLMLGLLLIVETGCPHTWGRGGTIDMAVRKEMDQSLRNRCWLSTVEWNAICGNDYWQRPKDERSRCPEYCRPARPW
ncbi:MAG TPA: hypothetical protein VK458_10965 [Myxococcaceae bacterium]|nr:hypothetical protein [Myxococcaceae bacterium]